MNLVKRFMTQNRCYTNATKIKVTKLVLHSLGCAQPSANVLIAQWDNSTAEVCVHGFVENDRVVQVLPWDYKGWHVGLGAKGSYNSCSIGIEICEPTGHKYNGGTMIGYDIAKNEEYFSKVYRNAVELFALLCKENKLDPVQDIVCHSEVYALGYGSNHADVMQWFPKHGKSMDTFREDVKKELEKCLVPTKTITPESSKEDIKWAQEKLNAVLPKIEGITPLKINGSYGPEVRIAVLIYWNMIGWGKDIQDNGTRIGKLTIGALADKRIK